jgi:hypothetical protein
MNHVVLKPTASRILTNLGKVAKSDLIRDYAEYAEARDELLELKAMIEAEIRRRSVKG